MRLFWSRLAGCLLGLRVERRRILMAARIAASPGPPARSKTAGRGDIAQISTARSPFNF